MDELIDYLKSKWQTWVLNRFYPDGEKPGRLCCKKARESSVRKLTAPLESVAVFQNLITDIISSIPWGCVDYVSNGATIDGCLKGTKRYAGKVVYENALARTVELEIYSSKCDGWRGMIRNFSFNRTE